MTIWGRGPASSGTPVAAAALYAARRERARLLLRSKASWTPWAPPDLGGGTARNQVRGALLAGAVVEIGSAGPRVLDEAAGAAGGSAGSFHVGSGGAVMARMGDRLLRVAAAGSPGDPSNAAAALEALAVAGDPRIPRLDGHGRTLGAAWAAESLLAGSKPRRVTPRVWEQCVGLCAALPSAGSPVAVTEDFDALAAALPDHAAGLARARDRALELVAGLGAAARHGDLWRPNLLTAGDDLTGVVDWDAWHPAAAPGTDLLNLFASERHGASLGAAWAAAPWRTDEFRTAARGYWAARGEEPGPAEIEGVALAWWAGQAAASLRRLPHLAGRPAWVDANVAAVLGSL